MKKLTTVVVLLLAGCGGVSYPSHWQEATNVCIGHKGVNHIWTESIREPKSYFIVYCNDGYTAKVWNFGGEK